MIPFSWIFGNSAVNRWKKKPENWGFFNDQYCKKNNIKTQWIEMKKEINVFEIEETERSRYFNTEFGLLHCSDHVRYNVNSSFCKRCKYQEICDVN
jgi:hypothetical protein